MSQTEKSYPQILPVKKNSVEKKNLKFAIELSDEDYEDLKANFNKKKEITEFVENSSHKNSECDNKNIKEEENEKNNNSKIIDTSNANPSEIKADLIPEIEKKIIENADISNNNNIMEIDEFREYKTEINNAELNYRTQKKEKNQKYKKQKNALKLKQEQENIELELLYANKRREMLEQMKKLEEDYTSDKNKLKLKHSGEILELEQKYKDEKKQVTEEFEKKKMNIEQNLGKYVIDTMQQKDKDLKLFLGSINLKKRNERAIINIKKEKENKLVSCDEIKVEYVSSKMGNIGCDQKNNNEEIKNGKQNNEIENGSLSEKK